MSREDNPQAIEYLRCAQPSLWLIAILFFGLGDVVTTGVGLEVDRVYEAGVITGALLDRYGQLSMMALKVGLFAGCYVFWRIAPRPHRIGVPLGLAVLGVTVVWWNLFVTVLAIRL